MAKIKQICDAIAITVPDTGLAAFNVRNGTIGVFAFKSNTINRIRRTSAAIKNGHT
ncbi:hypothetical protein D3C76_1865110 [compost metagenome]